MKGKSDAGICKGRSDSDWNKLSKTLGTWLTAVGLLVQRGFMYSRISGQNDAYRQSWDLDLFRTEAKQMRNFWKLTGICVSATYAVLTNGPLAVAEGMPTMFDVYTEMDFNDYVQEERHSAYAIGENYLGWFAYDHETTFDAKATALKECNARVDRDLKKTDSQTCELLAVDGEYVWKIKRPPAIGSVVLPLPDKPLNNSIIVGDLAKADAIVLALHGCDVPGIVPPDWTQSWYRFFKSRNIAVVQPDSFADPHPEVCPGKGTDAEVDEVLRLRVNQTIRTLGLLEKKFVTKPIYIWGHSQGARVAQIHDFGVDGVILSGDWCGQDAIKRNTPVLMVIGEEDQYVKFGGETRPITEDVVKENCPNYANNENRSFVVVKKMDHFTAIWHQNVMDAVSKFLNVKNYNTSFEKWLGPIPAELKSEANTYKTAPMHSAFAIRPAAKPGDKPQGFVITSWEYKSDAEQMALQECERGGDYETYKPDQKRACKLVDSK